MVSIAAYTVTHDVKCKSYNLSSWYLSCHVIGSIHSALTRHDLSRACL